MHSKLGTDLLTSILLACILSFFSVSGEVFADNKLPLPEIVKINDRVIALIGPVELPNKTNRGYMVNSTVIIGSKGVILVDTGFTNEIGQHLKKIIAGITSKPVTHIINTHDHGDHTLGNSEFSDAVIISSENCKATMEKSGYEWIGLVETMTEAKFPKTKPVPASKTYKENSSNKMSLDGVELELWVPNGSHTNNDMIVILPKDKVLIAGDIVVNTIIPNFRDAYVGTWINTLDDISRMSVKHIIPGHGTVTTPDKVGTMAHEMKKLYKGIEAGYKKGLMDSEIRKTLDLSYWKKFTYFDEIMGGNINRTYLEVESENF